VSTLALPTLAPAYRCARQKAENEGRLTMKKKHSDKKSARRGGGKPDY
jgi:hypothetical protein